MVVEKRVSVIDVCQACEGCRIGKLVCAMDATNQRIEIMLGRKAAGDDSSRGDRKKGEDEHASKDFQA